MIVHINFVYVLIFFLVSIFVLSIGYWYWLYYKYFISGCHKLTGPKFMPLIGHVLQFPHVPSTLKKILNSLEEHNGIAKFMGGFHFGLVVTDPKLTEFILSSKPDTIKTKIRTFNYYFLENWLGETLLLSAGQKSKNIRKILYPIFYTPILNQYIDVIEGVSDLLVKLIQNEVESGSHRTDLCEFIPNCALDIISESALQVKLNCQEDRNSTYRKAVGVLSNIAMLRMFDPLKHYNLLYKWTPLYHKEKSILKVVHGYTDSIIKKKRKELTTANENMNGNYTAKKKEAFLDILLQGKIDGEPLSDKDIRDQLEGIMFAGHDTTAITLCLGLYSIAKHPEVQENMLQEQRSIFADDYTRIATTSDLQAMKYLDLVIKEIMRLYPAVPSIGRIITEDLQYDGMTFKKGLNINILIFGIHRNPKYFPDPEKFDPERFNNENFPASGSYKYLPFSAGSRNCIGYKFGILEMKIVLSKIIRNFVLYPIDEVHELQLIQNLTLTATTGAPIKLEKRIWK